MLWSEEEGCDEVLVEKLIEFFSILAKLVKEASQLIVRNL